MTKVFIEVEVDLPEDEIFNKDVVLNAPETPFEGAVRELCAEFGGKWLTISAGITTLAKGQGAEELTNDKA